MEVNIVMTDIVKKSGVREATDRNVGTEVYQKLDNKVRELIERASERAEANGRKTVKARDV